LRGDQLQLCVERRGLGCPAGRVQPYAGLVGGSPASTARRVLAAPGRWVDAAIWKREELPGGFRIEGPAVIEEADSTTWVPEGFEAIVDATSCLLLSQTGGDAL
jgi:N-methylhydantoinase A